MKAKELFLIFLISQVLTQSDDYEELVKITVSEEYCTEVISNITTLLEQGYVFLDFYKSPLQPENNESYAIEKLDLIQELNDIPKKDRKYYDFIRDINQVIRKTGDNHLNFSPKYSPTGKAMSNFYFGIPFWFKVIDDFDDDGNVNDTYLIITDEADEDGYEDDFVPPEIKVASPSYEDYLNKKIISINDTDPFEFIENLFSIFPSGHNSQINYVFILDTIQNINIFAIPFYKEELSNIKLEFEDGDEYTFNYTFSQYTESSAIQRYYLEKLNKNINKNLPPPNYREVYKEYTFKYKPRNKKLRKMQTVEWDHESKNGLIKCKVDEDNKKNVLYQKSFSPENFTDYETVIFTFLDV